MSRRQFLKSSLITPVVPSLLIESALAQTVAYPNRPLVVVVPWPAGGGTDVTTRAVADALSRELAQSVHVENKAGANGAIGLTHVARAAADGYVLATATADTHSINPHLRADLPYDAVGGITPLIVYSTTYWAWMVRPDFPANNVAELLTLAKLNPGGITYASWGIGSTAHVAGALLESAGKVQLNHVPFPGSAPAVTAIQGGHVDMMPLNRSTAEKLRKAGKVKIIATSAPTRSKTILTDVPTLAEQGIADAEAGSWYGISIRSGAPDSVRQRLVEALSKVVNSSGVVGKISAAGMDPVSLQGAEMNDFLRSQYERYGAVIRQKQIKFTN